MSLRQAETPTVAAAKAGFSAGISVRVAEELGRVVNDGSRQRILPVIGTGSLQNITDLRLLVDST